MAAKQQVAEQEAVGKSASRQKIRPTHLCRRASETSRWILAHNRLWAHFFLGSAMLGSSSFASQAAGAIARLRALNLLSRIPDEDGFFFSFLFFALDLEIALLYMSFMYRCAWVYDDAIVHVARKKFLLLSILIIECISS